MTTGQSPDAASKDSGVHAVSLGLYPAIGMLEGQWPVFLPNTEEVYRDSANAVEKVIRIGSKKRISGLACRLGTAVLEIHS
jgi:hypothetical protein